MSEVPLSRCSCSWWKLAIVTALCLLSGGVLTGCRRHHEASVPLATPPSPAPSPESPVGEAGMFPDEERIGIASWYGHPYHGRRTSNGETYDMNTLTAAHRTLPFDTLVSVQNLENGKKVGVRINDRGPFVKDRIIDLSLAAAKQIEMVGPGTARVRLDLVKPVKNPFPLTIQVGAFKLKSNAEKIQRELAAIFSPIQIQAHESERGLLYRVLAGQFKDYPAAVLALRELQQRHMDGFIVRLDPQ